jgi:hypothetical protein
MTPCAAADSPPGVLGFVPAGFRAATFVTFPPAPSAILPPAAATALGFTVTAVSSPLSLVTILVMAFSGCAVL